MGICPVALAPIHNVLHGWSCFCFGIHHESYQVSKTNFANCSNFFRFFCFFFSAETSTAFATILSDLKTEFFGVHENMHVAIFGAAEATFSKTLQNPKGKAK
jgi:hypothetical protein